MHCKTRPLFFLRSRKAGIGRGAHPWLRKENRRHSITRRAKDAFRFSEAVRHIVPLCPFNLARDSNGQNVKLLTARRHFFFFTLSLSLRQKSSCCQRPLIVFLAVLNYRAHCDKDDTVRAHNAARLYCEGRRADFVLRILDHKIDLNRQRLRFMTHGRDICGTI